MWAVARRRFGTLRWKLASSYVLVTVLVILTIETILLLVVVPLLIRTVLPTAAASISRTVAAELQPDFAAPDRSPAMFAARLRDLRQPSDSTITFDLNDPQTTGTATVPPDVELALLDETGELITATDRLVAQSGGVEAVIVSTNGLTVIERALRGETSIEQQALRGENGVYLAAAPVIQDQRVLGVVFVQFPPLPATTLWGSVLAVLLTSAAIVVVASAIIGLLYGLIAGRGFSRRLKRLADASAGVARGDLSQRVDDRSVDEIGQLGRQFNTMAAQLDTSMRDLRSLADQNAQLAEQAGQLAIVEERNRLARDLHDSVSQELFSLTLLSAAAKRQVHTNPHAAVAQLDEIIASAQHALQETRSLIFALRPAMLDDRGLVPALRDLVAAGRDRQGLNVDLVVCGERRLPLTHAQALFRIVQEALANVVRHSGVREAHVELVYDDHEVQLTVADCGRGFDPSQPPGTRSIGLQSMRERVAALGGRIDITSASGRGTAVVVALPLIKEGNHDN